MIQNFVSKNKPVLLAILLLSLLSACANMNPYGISNNSYATLTNWGEKKGTSYISYCFNHVDEHFLDWGWFKPRNKAHFKIKPGSRKLIINIIYAPQGFLKFGGALNLYEVFTKIEINAKEGKTYRPNAAIKGNVVEIWIEEVGGEQISNTVTEKFSPYMQK